MIATIFTTLALGIGSLTTAGYALFGAIVASTTFVAGSFITTGHQFIIPDSGTTTTPSVYYGTVNNKILEYTGSGVTTYTEGLVRGKEYVSDCTATGGLTAYSPCWLPMPFATSGSLIDLSIECGENVGIAVTGDVAFKTSVNASSGTILTNLDNILIGSGSIQRVSFTTEESWNSANGIAFTTLETPGVSFDCKMFATANDKYGD